jgi:hypothetical protein
MAVLVAALRRVAIVRAPHEDDPDLKIEVCLAQAEQLAFAQARVDGGREQRSPSRATFARTGATS